MSDISTVAAAVREGARRSDGRFGSSSASESGVELDHGTSWDSRSHSAVMPGTLRSPGGALVNVREEWDHGADMTHVDASVEVPLTRLGVHGHYTSPRPSGADGQIIWHADGTGDQLEVTAVTGADLGSGEEPRDILDAEFLGVTSEQSSAPAPRSVTDLDEDYEQVQVCHGVVHTHQGLPATVRMQASWWHVPPGAR